MPGFEAPVKLAYSAKNRSASIRIPYVANPKGRRIEARFPDPLCNPYLGFSALLMAGLDGVENKIHPGEAATKDLYHLPPEEDAKIPTVCHSLDQALDYLDKDRAFLTKGGVFTDTYLDAYIELKMQEVTRFRMTTHPVEFDMYYTPVVLRGPRREGRREPPFFVGRRRAAGPPSPSAMRHEIAVPHEMRCRRRLLVLAALAACWPLSRAGAGRSKPVYRCPGTPVLYTDAISAAGGQGQAAAARIEGAPITRDPGRPAAARRRRAGGVRRRDRPTPRSTRPTSARATATHAASSRPNCEREEDAARRAAARNTTTASPSARATNATTRSTWTAWPR